ncbi:hypothetical protein A3760_21730 [Oleiphilus sp. HI0122]|nr:hypothetical protein A3760_21730 [Oleiphilus sp. HI0122]
MPSANIWPEDSKSKSKKGIFSPNKQRIIVRLCRAFLTTLNTRVFMLFLYFSGFFSLFLEHHGWSWLSLSI